MTNLKEVAKKQLNGGATDWIIRLLLGTGVVWGLAQLTDMHRELDAAKSNIVQIQATHFTAVEANTNHNALHNEIAALRNEHIQIMSLINEKADRDDVPPPVVLRQLDTINDRITRLEQLHIQ